MGATNAGPGWDESIHNVDGSHRQSPPSDDPAATTAWQAKRLAHINVHIAEAKQANEPLRKGGDVELADLADKVSEVTEGQVYYCYTTVPNSTGYYVFQGIDGRHTRNDIIARLHTRMAQPPGM